MIDNYDAPDGFIAVSNGDKYCKGCYFEKDQISRHSCIGSDLGCCSRLYRKDKHNVIFIKELPEELKGE
jgi:hypothetical protein